MSITIRDVAKRLNLSITTVSRALDGYDDVAEDTRRLVEETGLQMGYVPNQAARQLRRQRSDTIGYILPAEKPSFVILSLPSSSPVWAMRLWSITLTCWSLRQRLGARQSIAPMSAGLMGARWTGWCSTASA